MSRVKKNTRAGFKVDSLLSTKEKQTGVIVLGDFLSIIFIGFFDKYTEQDSIQCETKLIKFCHNKRKDTNASFTAHTVSSPIFFLKKNIINHFFFILDWNF